LSLPDLYRLDLALVVRVMHVDQDLGGLTDPRQCDMRVALGLQREIGDGVQLEQVGADHPEEIAHHVVGGPGREEIRQAVTDVERAAPVVRDQLVDLDGKGLEPALRFQPHRADARPFRYEGIVMSEPQVDDLPPLRRSGGNEGLHEAAVVFDVVHAPDHVVTDTQPVEDGVEALDSGGNDRGWTCLGHCGTGRPSCVHGRKVGPAGAACPLLPCRSKFRYHPGAAARSGRIA
jgi:hypothetical protein